MPNGDHNYQYGKFEGEVMKSLESIHEKLDSKVDRSEFMPVKSIAYGVAGIILAAVATALVSQVVQAAIK